MKLLIVRHATAEDGGPRLRDWDRALTDHGRAEASLVSHALQTLELQPDVVLSSPLVRARQTAEIVAGELGVDMTLAEELQAGDATLDHVQRLLARHTAETALLVGHEPDLSSLAARLVNADERGMLLKKGGLIRVDIEGRVQAGRGRLVWLLTPRVMGAMTRSQ
jgi:phosphohistidine phosphatase